MQFDDGKIVAGIYIDTYIPWYMVCLGSCEIDEKSWDDGKE